MDIRRSLFSGASPLGFVGHKPGTAGGGGGTVYALSSTNAALTSAAGADPTVDLTFGADIFPGFYLRIIRSADGAKNVDGSYVTPTMDIIHTVTETERAAEAIPNADLTPDGYSSPSGAYWQSYRWEREDGAFGPWSEVSGTVTAIVAQLSQVNGTEKNANVVVSGAPVLTWEANPSTNSATSVRMDRTQANDGWHVEVEIVSMNAAGGGNGNLVVGVMEGPTTPSLVGALTGFPGNAAGIPGFCVIIGVASTNFSLRRNGATSNIALPGGTVAVAGDRFIIEYKHSTKRIDTWFYRAATGITTAMHVNVVLTSQIPASVNLFGTSYRTTDKAKFHVDPAEFQQAATAGYSYYA